MEIETQTSSGSPTHVRVVLAGLFTIVLVSLGMTPAWAHDHLESTSPSDGSTVTAPTRVVLHLAEPPVKTGTEMRVTGPQGEMAGTLQIAGSDVTDAFAAPLPAGDYTVLWRVTSDDGHPVSGQFRFTVAASGSARSGAGSGSANGSGLTAPASNGSASATSTSPTPPPKQTPTDKTDNSPVLVLGGAALALIVIAAIALFARSRLKNDE